MIDYIIHIIIFVQSRKKGGKFVFVVELPDVSDTIDALFISRSVRTSFQSILANPTDRIPPNTKNDIQS